MKFLDRFRRNEGLLDIQSLDAAPQPAVKVTPPHLPFTKGRDQEITMEMPEEP